MTCITNCFYGRSYVDAVECLNDKRVAPNSSKYVEIDARSKRKGKITFRDMAVMYGQRPNDKRIWYLSPYEFETDWEVNFLSYPQSLHDTDNPRHHAELTDAGIAKLHDQHPGEKTPELYPAVDYVVKAGGDDWLAFPDVPTTSHFRHTWIIKKRRRPIAPMFMGAPVPSKRADAVDHSAMLTMAYFHPWTLRADDEEGVAVPFAGRLRASEESWDTALRTWLDGNVISCESVRYISNFLSVYRVRPRDPNEDARSDEDFSDEDLVLNEDMLEQAMKTRVGGKEKNRQRR
jgi:hypothetical protein